MLDEELQTLLKVRWYALDSTLGDIHDIVEDEEEKPTDRKKPAFGAHDEEVTASFASSLEQAESGNKMLRLYLSIRKSLVWYCKLVKLVVASQQCRKQQLKVYAELLKRFTYACEKWSKCYAALEDLLNDRFEVHFPTHPHFPKFTFWRMFIRIWCSETHLPLQPTLDEECLSLLANLREASFRNERERCAEADAKPNKRTSNLSSLFSPTPSEVDLLIAQSYVSSLKNLSLQEVSIHFMPHSQVLRSASPYGAFEEKFLFASQAYATRLFEELLHDTRVYDRFLECEATLISQVFLNRTYHRFYTEISKSLLQRIECAVGEFSAGPSIQDEQRMIEMKENDPKDEQRLNLLAEIVSYGRSPETKRAYDEQGFEEIMCQRTASVSLNECFEQAKALWEYASEELVQMLDFYAHAVKLLKDVREKFAATDDCIETQNEEAGVPMDLGSSEPLYAFYSRISE